MPFHVSRGRVSRFVLAFMVASLSRMASRAFDSTLPDRTYEAKEPNHLSRPLISTRWDGRPLVPIDDHAVACGDTQAQKQRHDGSPELLARRVVTD